MGEMLVKLFIKIFSKRKSQKCWKLLLKVFKNHGSVEKCLSKFCKSKTLFIDSDDIRCSDSGVQELEQFLTSRSNSSGV